MNKNIESQDIINKLTKDIQCKDDTIKQLRDEALLRVDKCKDVKKFSLSDQVFGEIHAVQRDLRDLIAKNAQELRKLISDNSDLHTIKRFKLENDLRKLINGDVIE